MRNNRNTWCNLTPSITSSNTRFHLTLSMTSSNTRFHLTLSMTSSNTRFYSTLNMTSSNTRFHLMLSMTTFNTIFHLPLRMVSSNEISRNIEYDQFLQEISMNGTTSLWEFDFAAQYSFCRNKRLLREFSNSCFTWSWLRTRAL